MVMSDFRPEVEIQLFGACAMKNTQYNPYGRIAEISASYRKSGSRNMTVTSDFKPEVEIWPFRACAICAYKNYNTLPLPELHNYQLLRLVHKYHYRNDKLPAIFSNYFSSSKDIHYHHTRSSSLLHLITFIQR